MTTGAAVAERVAELQAAGIAASDEGRPALGARRLRQALRLLDAEPADRNASDRGEVRGRLLVSLAWAESERGRVELGYRLLDEAETLMPAGRQAVLHAQRAVMFRHNGRNDLALPEFDTAIAGLNERQYADDLVRALNNRSLLHLDAGQVGAARDDLDRCRRIAERHGLDLGVTIAELNIACLEVVAGDLPRALRGFTRSQTKLHDQAPGMLTAVAVEKARGLIAAGLLSEADSELAAAMELARSLRQSHNYADAVQVRADVAVLAGRPAAAIGWAREAGAEFRARRNPRRAALSALLALRAEFDEPGGPTGHLAGRARRLARELRRLGLDEDARVALLVAARCRVRGRSARTAEPLIVQAGPPGRIDALDTRLLWRLTRAEVARAAGRPTDAARHLIAGMTTLHRHRALLGCLDLRTGTSAHGRDLARAGLRAALADGSVAGVYRWSERARAQASLLPPVRPPDDPAAAASLEQLRQTRYALHEAELAGRPAGELRAQVERLQREVREQSWSMAGPGQVTGVSPAPLSRVRPALGGAALVTYLRDGPDLAALVVTRRSAAVVRLGSTYRETEEAVLRLRADLDTQAGRALPARMAAAVTATTVRDAARLAQLVLDPVLPLIGDRDLVVVPTGLLMTTPWALLPGCTGRPVTVASSATAWLAARDRRLAPAGRTVLVAGPGIRRGVQEVQAIAGLYPGAAVLTGRHAGPGAAVARLDGAGVAHLAAHGRHQAENALFSTLELAGGPLLGYDLQRLTRPPSMIVLSSCELGLSDVRPGDESFGMASALLAAGTSTVVASVSRVADDAAMTVMIRFHTAVAAGSEPAPALASALSDEPTAGFVCLGA